MPFVLAGSRTYLERRGPLRHPDDIACHRLVPPTYTTNIGTVTLTGPNGAFTVKNQAALKTNDTSMALQLVRPGMGLAYFPSLDRRSGTHRRKVGARAARVHGVCTVRICGL